VRAGASTSPVAIRPTSRTRPHLAALRTSRARAGVRPDGLDAIRRIVAGAAAHCAAGWLLLEHGHDQAEAVQALLAGRLRRHRDAADLAGIARCTGGRAA
jgi:release factor glutamine methyltransferase